MSALNCPGPICSQTIGLTLPDDDPGARCCLALATLFWVPVSVWIGLRPRVAERVQPLAQFLAAFPVNVLFPMAVIAILHLRLNPDIWLSPLIIFGTQWYIVFNVIAGASAFPNDLKEAASPSGRRVGNGGATSFCPGSFPTTLRARSPPRAARGMPGSSRNTSAGATTRLRRMGLALISRRRPKPATIRRSFSASTVMSVFVIVFNRLLWRPLFGFAGATSALRLKEFIMLDSYRASPLLEVRHLSQRYRKGSGEIGAPDPR